MLVICKQSIVRLIIGAIVVMKITMFHALNMLIVNSVCENRKSQSTG